MYFFLTVVFPLSAKHRFLVLTHFVPVQKSCGHKDPLSDPTIKLAVLAPGETLLDSPNRGEEAG